MFCQGCGKEIPDDTMFCPACGRPTSSKNVQPKQPSRPTGTPLNLLNNKRLLIIGGAVIVLLIIIILVIGKKDKKTDNNSPVAESNTTTESEATAPIKGNSILGAYTGDWRSYGDSFSNSYADNYEMPYYLRIESDGMTAVAEAPNFDEGSGEFSGETVYWEVGAKNMNITQEGGKDYIEFNAELYAGVGNGRNMTGIRFYYDNAEELLVCELNTPEDGHWVKRQEFYRIDSIQGDRNNRGINLGSYSW